MPARTRQTYTPTRTSPREIIRQLAQAAGTTRADGSVHIASFAEVTGITGATVSRLLAGKIRDMSPRTVSRLAAVFGITASQASGHEPLPERLRVVAPPEPSRETAGSAEEVLAEIRALRTEVRSAIGQHDGIAAEVLSVLEQLPPERQQALLHVARSMV